jgi:hypothetical protein
MLSLKIKAVFDFIAISLLMVLFLFFFLMLVAVVVLGIHYATSGFDITLHNLHLLI